MKNQKGVVNVFSTPYEDWSKRNSTYMEIENLVTHKGLSLIEALTVNDKLLEVISTPFEAATRILRKRVDNGLESHIDRALDVSAEYRDLRASMPQELPIPLDTYQNEYPDHDQTMADKAIKAHGIEMAEGQFLFHGGHWSSAKSILITSKLFSTSFCPQVALRNAEWRGKAYEAGRVDLMVVRVTKPKTKAYVYSRTGNHGNEKEVVFASGAQLTRVRETYITEMPVSKLTSNLQLKNKIVPAYLIEVEIS